MAQRFFTANGCVHPIRHAPGYRAAKARGHCPACAGGRPLGAAHGGLTANELLDSP